MVITSPLHGEGSEFNSRPNHFFFRLQNWKLAVTLQSLASGIDGSCASSDRFTFSVGNYYY